MILTEYEEDYLKMLQEIPLASNTEISTPYKMVQKSVEMLDDKIIADPNSKYLSLGSKNGMFPLMLMLRLLKEMQGEFSSRKEKELHILKNQIFVDCTSLNALNITKKTLYNGNANEGKCSSVFDSKNGNVRFLASSKDGYGRPIWWGAVKNSSASNYEYGNVNGISLEEVFGMQFDAVIGNPPYQVPTSGRTKSNPQSQPIYHQIVMAAASLKPKQISMIIPSRWMTAASKGGWDINEFRTFMTAGHIKEIHDYEKSSMCFGNSIDLKGGVCYWSWHSDYCGDALYVEHHADGTIYSEKRPLMLDGYDCIIRRAEVVAVLDHLKSLGMDSFSTLVSPTEYFGRINNNELKNAPQLDESSPDAIKMYGFINHCASAKIVDKSIVTRHHEDIGKPKLFVPKIAGGAGMAKDVFHFISADPGSAATSTYLMIGPFNTVEERESCRSYLETKFAHFCIGCIKSSHSNCSLAYRYLPLVDFSHGLWTDERIRKELRLTDEFVRTIDSLVWSQKASANAQ